MTECNHESTQGDNYGKSCLDCGAALEGYGYGGFFGANLAPNTECIHEWVFAEEGQEECLYCHVVR